MTEQNKKPTHGLGVDSEDGLRSMDLYQFDDDTFFLSIVNRTVTPEYVTKLKLSKEGLRLLYSLMLAVPNLPEYPFV